MKKLQFTVNINASKEKVWSALWDDTNYREWTSVFSEGSYAESDWNEGSKILFLSPGGSGMYSTIARKIPNQFMSFKHLGVVKDGVEQPVEGEAANWSGALENYTLVDKGNATQLDVEIDMAESHVDYFNDAFPKALSKVKEIAEK